MIKSKFGFLEIILLLFILGSCNSADEDFLPPNADSVLYFNSFENSSDLDGVEGHAFELSDETTGQSGSKSLLVSGGCIGPHFILDLGPFTDDKELALNFIGKTEAKFCGSVSLSSLTTNNRVDISLTDQNWIFYESTEPLFLPKGEKLRIEISSGGIFSCASFVDLLTIEER